MAITNYSELKASIADWLNYDSSIGVFTWKQDMRGPAKSGDVAGCVRPDGYITIKVNGKSYLAHRLAWIFAYGSEPPRIIDHVNGDKKDNSIQNLRNGSGGVNERNPVNKIKSSLLISGVRKSNKSGFQAYFIKDKKFTQLYSGDDFFEACCARKSWESKFWEGVQ